MNNFRMVPALAALAIILTASTSASVHAQTVLGGHYDNNKSGDGYDALTTGSQYIVTPTATFNNNGNAGLYTVGTILTVNGGTFDGNFIGFDDAATVSTVNAGTFSGNLDGLDAAGNVTINGGYFGNNGGYGFSLGNNSTAAITGGTFGANGDEDIFATSFASVITVYGTFSKYGALPASSGYFTGTLENTPGIQTIHYANQGTIILAPAAVPEASTLTGFSLLGLGLLALGLVARRKKVS